MSPLHSSDHEFFARLVHLISMHPAFGRSIFSVESLSEVGLPLAIAKRLVHVGMPGPLGTCFMWASPTEYRDTESLLETYAIEKIGSAPGVVSMMLAALHTYDGVVNPRYGISLAATLVLLREAGFSSNEVRLSLYRFWKWAAERLDHHTVAKGCLNAASIRLLQIILDDEARVLESLPDRIPAVAEVINDLVSTTSDKWSTVRDELAELVAKWGSASDACITAARFVAALPQTNP